MADCRFPPPPWTIDDANDARFIVRDSTGQALGYFYFEDEPADDQRPSSSPGTRRGAWRSILPSCRKLGDKIAGEGKRSPIKLRRMEAPDQDRTKADDCLRKARAARTREERLLYLGLAAIWLQVALVKDGATDIRLPPAPHL